MVPTTDNASSNPAPTKQLGRPVFFRVRDDKAVGAGHILSINPEDLSITEPSRMSVQQTIGSAWVDNFGPGLRTISISGTTGWRANHETGRDWEAEYNSLYKESFVKWHSLRADKITAGQDPGVVELEFVDALDKVAVIVAPVSFVLKRNKNRPLLIQYSIVLNVLRDIKDFNYGMFDPASSDTKLRDASFLDSMDKLATSINDWTAKINGYAARFSKALQPVRDFLDKANKVMNAVKNALNVGDAFIAAIVGIAQQIATAGRNMFSMLAAIANFPTKIAGYFSGIASIFSNLVCLFANGFKKALGLPNFNDFYGASSCSSTAGGSPLSPLRNQNGLALLS